MVKPKMGEDSQKTKTGVGKNNKSVKSNVTSAVNQGFIPDNGSEQTKENGYSDKTQDTAATGSVVIDNLYGPEPVLRSKGSKSHQNNNKKNDPAVDSVTYESYEFNDAQDCDEVDGQMADTSLTADTGYSSFTGSGYYDNESTSDEVTTISTIYNDSNVKEAPQDEILDSLYQTMMKQEDFLSLGYFTVPIYGGHFLLQMGLSLLIPEKSIGSESVNLTVTQFKNCELDKPKLHGKAVDPFRQWQNLSDVFEFQPHSQKFHESVTIKMPLTKQPSEEKKTEVVLFYGKVEDKEVIQWTGFSDNDTEEPEDESLSWCIMGNYCYIMVDHFSRYQLLEFETETAEENNENQEENNTDQNDLGGVPDSIEDNNEQDGANSSNNSSSCQNSSGANQNNDLNKGSTNPEEEPESMEDNIAVGRSDSNNDPGNNQSTESSLESTDVKENFHDDSDQQSDIESITTNHQLASVNSSQTQYIFMFVFPKWNTQNDNTINSTTEMNFCIKLQSSDDWNEEVKDVPEDPFNIIKEKWSKRVACVVLPQDFEVQTAKLNLHTASYKLAEGEKGEKKLCNVEELSETFCLKPDGLNLDGSLKVSVKIQGTSRGSCFICFGQREVTLEAMTWEISSDKIKALQEEYNTRKRNTYMTQKIETNSPPQEAEESDPPYDPVVTSDETTRKPQIVKCRSRNLEDEVEVQYGLKISEQFRGTIKFEIYPKLKNMSTADLETMAKELGMKQSCRLKAGLFLTILMDQQSLEIFIHLYKILKTRAALQEVADHLELTIQKELIRNKLEFIANDIQMCSLKQKIVTELIIHENERERINNMSDDKEMAKYVLSNNILKGSRDVFDKFVQCLIYTNQTHIADRFLIWPVACSKYDHDVMF